MVTIRQGMMKDCTDLLEVYQNTRWFYRTKEEGYRTVEQVKQEHRGAAFERWGWLVAEEKGHVVGEVVFRSEKTPSTGKVGIIRNLDVDVRKQKATIGTKLTNAAETVMKNRKVSRVIATTPPAAYNYWMKVKYFSRGSIVNLKLPLSKVAEKKSTQIKTIRLQNPRKLPTSMKFSNIAYPGLLAERAADVIDGKRTGRLFEYYLKNRLIGVGVVVKQEDNSAIFVADLTKRGLEYSDIVISRTAKAASAWKVKTVKTTVPKDQVDVYMSISNWSSEISTDIPVTRLL
jgi:N-acetylglutamate synthase-like GNAT family acetyltransferase